MAQNIEEAVPFQHLFPQVPAAVARGVLGIAGPALDFSRVAASVEGEEKGASAHKAGGHVNLIRVNGEMHQGSFLELEKRRAGVAIVLVLVDRIAPGLSGTGVFQLAGGHRQDRSGQRPGPWYSGRRDSREPGV